MCQSSHHAVVSTAGVLRLWYTGQGEVALLECGGAGHFKYVLRAGPCTGLRVTLSPPFPTAQFLLQAPQTSSVVYVHRGANFMLSMSTEAPMVCHSPKYVKGYDAWTLARRQCFEIQCQQDGGWYHVKDSVMRCGNLNFTK